MYFSQILNQKSEFYSEYLEESISNLLDKSFKIPNEYPATLYCVEEEYIARPDLLSLDLYGDERYADILCKLNGISNPYEMYEGQYMLIPSFPSLEKFYIKPAEAWKESNQPPTVAVEQAMPKLKKKTDKRKPNEAIVGDKRFNIDPISKIVIY